jgi:hypothetical protein
VKATGIARPAVVDPHVAAVGPAELLQSLLESRDAAPAFRIVRGHVHQHANTLHALGLLRPSRERHRRRSAAEQGDELSPSQVEHGASSRTSSQGR